MYLLLVDQNYITSSDLQEMIEQSPAGTDIVNCYSTETLLKIAERVKPDIVLIDFDVAGDNLEGLFKQIRGVSENAHIIALITGDNYEDLNKAIETGGVDDFIVKPILKEDFMARVHIAAQKIKPAAAPAAFMADEPVSLPVEAFEIDDALVYKTDDSVAAGEILQADDKPVAEDQQSAFFEDDTAAELPDETEAEEAVLESAFNDHDLLEPVSDDAIGVKGFTASGFFDEEQHQAEPDAVVEELAPEAEKPAESEKLFDDIAVFDEDPVKAIEEQAGPETADSFSDFDFPGDDQIDTVSPTDTFDGLFGEEQKESSSNILGDDLDLLDQATAFEESPDGDLSSWDFSEDDLPKSVDRQEPVVHDASKPNISVLKTGTDSGFVLDSTPASEQYFEDLFDDKKSASPHKKSVAQPIASPPQADDFDFFADEEPEPPVPRREVVRQSPLPGDSADDFLFGETDIEDINQVPDPLKQYVVDKGERKAKQTSDFDSFEDDFSFVDDEDVITSERKTKERKVKTKSKRGGTGSFLSVLGNVVFVVLLLMMATLSFFLIQSRISGGVPQVAGYQMYIVLSGSMNPEFDTGSLAFVKEIDPQVIVVGDIITFRGQSGSDTLTTHRVVEVLRDDGLKFVTRGDANNVNDPNPVLAENIVGTVTGSIPYLGYMMSFVQTRTGLILLIFVPGVLIILFELGKIVKYMTDGGDSKKRGSKKHSRPAEDFD